MKYYVEQDVLDLGVKILFVEINGIDNTIVSDEWKNKRESILQELLEKYQDIDYHKDPILEGFHILHDHAHIRRRKNIPASENLIRQLRRQNDLYFINQAVDIYNVISLESKLALGAHDIDHVDGDVTLRITDGDELFVPIGLGKALPVNSGEYSYCDDNHEVLCRAEIRQVEKTKVTDQTKNVFYIVQGNEYTDDQLLKETAQKIIDITTYYLGGEGKIIIPEVKNAR